MGPVTTIANVSSLFKLNHLLGECFWATRPFYRIIRFSQPGPLLYTCILLSLAHPRFVPFARTSQRLILLLGDAETFFFHFYFFCLFLKGKIEVSLSAEIRENSLETIHLFIFFSFCLWGIVLHLDELFPKYFDSSYSRST